MHSLKPLREKAGFSQDSLARVLGISVSTVSKWEQGLMRPHKDNLSKLVKILRCSYDDLLGGGVDEFSK